VSRFALMTSASAAAVTVLFAILIFAGVIMPAIWSRNRARRTAAAAVLQQILNFLSSRPRR
jgi:hypothetical protein